MIKGIRAASRTLNERAHAAWASSYGRRLCLIVFAILNPLRRHNCTKTFVGKHSHGGLCIRVARACHEILPCVVEVIQLVRQQLRVGATREIGRCALGQVSHFQEIFYVGQHAPVSMYFFFRQQNSLFRQLWSLFRQVGSLFRQVGIYFSECKKQEQNGFQAY